MLIPVEEELLPIVDAEKVSTGEGDEMANPLEDLPDIEDELDTLEDEIGESETSNEAQELEEAEVEPETQAEPA